MGVPSSRPAHRPFTPQLSVEWEPRRRVFWENLRTFLRRRQPPRGTLTPPYFRGTLTGFHFPARAVMASVLFHVCFVHFPLPGWPGESEEKISAPVQRTQLTWYGPIRDLPPLRPPRPRSKPSVPVEAKKSPPRGADAFHPRQTIVSLPRLPNHPRQTLIQPSAPQVAPKVLPPLPNIVLWTETPRPAKPRLKIRAPVIRRARARVASAPPAELPIPAVPNQETNIGELNIASSNVAAPRPRFVVTPMSVPQPGPRQSGSASSEPAPEIAPTAVGDGGIANLIALSAAPAPPAPVVEVPSGNLQSQTVISPEGTQPGAPANGSNPAAEAGPTGPPGISISGGNPKESSNVSGLSPGSPTRPLVLSPLPGRAAPRLIPAEPGRTRPAPGLDPIKPGAPPEELLGPKRVYTMHVNLPNLSSVTGSWVLRFAELDEKDLDGNGMNRGGNGGNSDDLSAPVPIRKVDPKYPPALVSARIEGEVILYAIIRKDGSVDSIQLVRSVEPQLDHNAIEALGRWKFRPAERRGEPVELEAIVHIPFRAVASVF